MHFEILVEDQSGKELLKGIVPKIIGTNNTYRIHAYKGIGHIPKNMSKEPNPSHRILLDRLPRILQGYGRTYPQNSSMYSAVIIVVCDLDDKCLKIFRDELFGILNSINPQPETRFCIAIEEGEAWLLGDMTAVKAGYPKARQAVLDSYENDSICGTWEKLADALYSGGSLKLKRQGWQAVGTEKSRWAAAITPHMDVENNRSPSFIYFKNTLRGLANILRT